MFSGRENWGDVMIDFTDCVEEFNTYKGSEKKKTLIYEGKRYLVKFPDPVREKGKNISYINNAFSEYVGSNVFRLINMDVQDTVLGYYDYHGRKKIVCACLDFTDDIHSLLEFENLALSTNPDKKITTDLVDIMEVLEEVRDKIDIEEVKVKFYQMFIIDSLIGNTDRHNGNWGFLFSKNTGDICFSPIYDCGSCLNPMLEDEELEKMNETELKNLAMNCYSCLREGGKRIAYMSYIKSMKNENCNQALKFIFPKIDMDKINDFIDGIGCMSVCRKEFYKKIIYVRYEVLESVYHQVMGE